jgi:2-desacetyl-2-hydroxyethyl bacteriochlorophyllide A dehydrogenase
MRSLWLESQKLEFRVNVPVPVPAEGEALIRVDLAGVCSTDLELLRGYYPFTGIPGHEFVGEVVRSPSDASWERKRVVGEINIACGVCKMCQSGLPRHCELRKTLGIHDWNGAFADYLVLPLVNLHTVPEAIANEAAVFTEPVAAAYEILEQVDVSHTDRVLIIGAGRLGQLVAQVLQTTGCNLEVIARHPKQRQLLSDRNIETVSDPQLEKKKYDVIVEATGTPGGFSRARELVRPRGTIVLKSTYQGETAANLSDIVVNEVRLIGSRCGPFEPALDLLAGGQVDPRPLIAAIYPLDQGRMAFEHAARPGVLKVLSQSG